MKTFILTAKVSSNNPQTIKKTLQEFIPDGTIKRAEQGFLIEANIQGKSARDLNRALLSALR
jgi:cell division septal protein FtsQ